MPSAGIASRIRLTSIGREDREAHVAAHRRGVLDLGLRARSMRSKFQVPEGTMSSLICHMALAMSPVTSICGK